MRLTSTLFHSIFMCPKTDAKKWKGGKKKEEKKKNESWGENPANGSLPGSLACCSHLYYQVNGSEKAQEGQEQLYWPSSTLSCMRLIFFFFLHHMKSQQTEDGSLVPWMSFSRGGGPTSPHRLHTRTHKHTLHTHTFILRTFTSLF